MKVEIRNNLSLWQNNMFTLEKANVRFEFFDGQMSPWVDRINFERGDSAAVLIYNRDTQKYGLIKQFRYSAYRRKPSDGWILELVAGTIEDGESPQENIIKELMEETGYSAFHQFSHLFTFYVSPGGASERIHLFYMAVNTADRTAEGGGLIESTENIQYLEFSLDELKSMLLNGELIDGKTIIAVQWLLLNLKDENI